MPSQPPRFRPAFAPAPKPWAPTRGVPDKRKRGRAGQRERAQVLAEEPLCRACLEAGRAVPSKVVDHITPLSEGGEDTRPNKQGLCDPCHDAKSKRERAEARKRREAM